MSTVFEVHARALVAQSMEPLSVFANHWSGEELPDLDSAEACARIVLDTIVPVAHVLSRIFPLAGTAEVFAVPDDMGNVVQSSLDAPTSYAMNALALAKAVPGTSTAVSHGRVVLQWCSAALAAAELTDNRIMQEDVFRIVEFIAREVPAKLRHTQAYLRDLKRWDLEAQLYYTGQAATLRERPAAPGPVSVRVPWPRELGVPLSSSVSDLERVFQIASDIIVTDDAAQLRYRSFTMRAPAADQLGKALDAELPSEKQLGNCKAGDLFEHSKEFDFDGVKFRTRIQRSCNLSGEVRYVFRVYPQTRSAVPNLSLFFAEPVT